MRLLRAWLVFVLTALLLLPAIPARAQSNQAQGRDLEIRGVVVSVDPSGHGFVLRRSRQESRPWIVRITEQTQVRLSESLADEDDDDDDVTVAVGDLVTVGGRSVGNRQLIARQVTIFGHAGQLPAPVPVPRPTLPSPTLFAPANGETFNTSEIVVIGRTVPGARVHIDLAAESSFRGTISSADAVADASGVFYTKVRVPWQASGVTYRITVISRLDGQVSSPTSVVVRHN